MERTERTEEVRVAENLRRTEELDGEEARKVLCSLRDAPSYARSYSTALASFSLSLSLCLPVSVSVSVSV